MARPILVVVAAIALAGCTSPGTKATGTVPAASTTASTLPATTPATSPASTAATTVAPATTSTVAGVTNCTVAELSVTAGATVSGLGHQGFPVMFRDSGGATCTLHGYPGVAALNASGAQVLQATRQPAGYLGGLASATVPVVTLHTGQTASALVESSALPPSNTTSCPTFAAFLVTPPNETHSVRLAVTLPGCAHEVHPVVAGATGEG